MILLPFYFWSSRSSQSRAKVIDIFLKTQRSYTSGSESRNSVVIVHIWKEYEEFFLDTQECQPSFLPLTPPQKLQVDIVKMSPAWLGEQQRGTDLSSFSIKELFILLLLFPLTWFQKLTYSFLEVRYCIPGSSTQINLSTQRSPRT